MPINSAARQPRDKTYGGIIRLSERVFAPEGTRQTHHEEMAVQEFFQKDELLVMGQFRQFGLCLVFVPFLRVLKLVSELQFWALIQFLPYDSGPPQHKGEG